MKKILFLLILLTVVSLVNGQGDFNKKKKTGGGANTSALNARNINGAVNNHQLKSTTGKDTLSPRQFFLQGKKVHYSQDGLPTFIKTTAGQSHRNKSTEADLPSLCFGYLNEIKPLLKMDDPENQFVIHSTNKDRFNKTHIRLDQVYKGLKVYGSQVMVHLNANGEGEIFNGNYQLIEKDIDVHPSITADQALTRAEQHLIARKRVPAQIQGSLPVGYEKPESELVIYQPKDDLLKENRLVYHITLYTLNHSRWEYFVDAGNGKIIYSYENICHVDGPKTTTALDLSGTNRTIHTYQIGSYYYMLDASRPMFIPSSSALPDEPAGGILTIDMNNTFGDNQSFNHVISNNNVWNNPTAVSAHYNAGVAYDYYRVTHGRNSIDGEGGTIISIINVPDDETGDDLDNAFWNGYFMCYGNGNIEFDPLARALDVAGHEMTHGVIQSTANLEYDGESGAINESMADIFGMLMDRDDWTIGEDVVKASAYPSGALRSLEDPHNGGSDLSENGFQPMHMSEKYNGDGDNHGVHVNSGIVNHAFYLFANAVGLDKAEEIYYKVLTDYLTKSSQFIDLRLAVIQATSDIYGENSNEIAQAEAAFDAVGITEGQPTGTIGSLPENPGEEYILIYSTDIDDPNSLYRSTISQDEAVPLTRNWFVSRPSVTDDGSAAVFVSEDYTIHGIYTAPGTDPDEWTLQDQTIWSNVVVSKDGNRIASVTNDSTDATIYVYDFISEEWVSYELYNPTFTDVTAPGPLYADALEFDYTGEYLVYDAFNRLPNNNGGNIEYWDVNFIHVWDNESNTFADGTIMKLFSGLPDGVSIGNPSFSKNSPNIIAFDYIDVNTEEYAIVGYNIETNEINVIATNNTIGWPSFNKDDSRVAFTTINNEDDYQTDYVELNPDKISSDGIHQGIYKTTMWPVYFATGIRNLEISAIPEGSVSVQKLQTYPNPFTDFVTIRLPEGVRKGLIEVFNQMGQLVYSEKFEKESADLKMNLSHLKSGYYVVRMKNEKEVFSGKILKK